MSSACAPPVGWALLGAGWVARDHMAPALMQRGSRVLSVADRDLAAARRLADLFPGAVASTSMQQAVDTPGVEAAYVATPNDAHLPAVRAASQAGVPVLCEKPLAAGLADAAAIVAACDGMLAGCAYDQRWHPAHRAMAGLLAAGDLGTVTAVRVVYGCWLPPTWLPPGDRSGVNWRADVARAGGGAYVDLAPPGIDLVGCLLGEDVVQATTRLQRRVHDYEVDDGAMLVGSTASDVLVSLHVSYNTADVLPRRVLEIVGTDAQLLAVDTMGQTAGGSLTRIDGVTGSRSAVPFDATVSPFAEQVAAFEDALRGLAPWRHPLERDLTLLHLLADAVPSEEITT